MHYYNILIMNILKFILVAILLISFQSCNKDMDYGDIGYKPEKPEVKTINGVLSFNL